MLRENGGSHVSVLTFKSMLNFRFLTDPSSPIILVHHRGDVLKYINYSKIAINIIHTLYYQRCVWWSFHWILWVKVSCYTGHICVIICFQGHNFECVYNSISRRLTTRWDIKEMFQVTRWCPINVPCDYFSRGMSTSEHSLITKSSSYWGWLLNEFGLWWWFWVIMILINLAIRK